MKHRNIFFMKWTIYSIIFTWIMLKLVNVPQNETEKLVWNKCLEDKSIESIGKNLSKLFNPANKPWYMVGGKKRPKVSKRTEKFGKREAKIWPEENSNDDRIHDQLMFIPANYEKSRKNKKIFIPDNIYGVDSKSDVFKNCPVDSCKIIHEYSSQADLVIFQDNVRYSFNKPTNQIWMLNLFESPYHTSKHFDNVINWTATYRRDGDIVYPYAKWQYYDPVIIQIPRRFNYAAGKTKKVAWMVSNCNERNTRRQYAMELSKYIEVDVFGHCGILKCPKHNYDKCLRWLRNDYKFYLAFENSNCRHYITEKLYGNSLKNNILPVVMGASRDDYAKFAPQKSYIHVDDFTSPKALADYLHELDKNDALYNSYFEWKGTGEFINHHFMCRVCTMLHDERPPKIYENINEWWSGKGVCNTNSLHI